MKILFLGDYSGLHATLADALRRMGHDCTVLSNGSRCMDTRRDIDLNRRPGLINSFKYLARCFEVVPRLKGYDVVQIVNPGFLSLKPGKLRHFFDIVRRNNGCIGLTLCGSDSFVVKDSLEGNLFRYSEFKVDGAPSPHVADSPKTIAEWCAAGLTDYCAHVYENVDFALSSLYEYHLLAQPHLQGKVLEYAGIPVDTRSIAMKELEFDSDGRIRIIAAIKSEMTTFKGTLRLLEAAREVERRHPDKVVVEEARDMKLTDYLRKIEESHIVLDQLYSYTPATNALQTMAMGRIAVSGGEPEFYDFIGEEKLRPVVNVVPDDRLIVSTLENLVTSPREYLRELSRQGRKFVEKHNSAEVVAKRYLNVWEKMIK